MSFPTAASVFGVTHPCSPQVKKLVTIIQNPRQYRIPDWFLNRQKDVKDGKWSQCVSNGLDNKLRGKSPARPQSSNRLPQQLPPRFRLLFFSQRRRQGCLGPLCATQYNAHTFGSPGACPVTEDLERLKKIRSHRGIRHYWGYGQASSLMLLLLLARCVPPSPPFLREYYPSTN